MEQAVIHGTQTGKNDYICPTKHVLPDRYNHTSLTEVCPVSRHRLCFFLFVEVSFFTDFLFEVFKSNLPLLPFTSIFTSFSEPHQAVISVLGAKVIPGLDGIARSSLLFCAEISTPAQAPGSISAKNLAIPNPYLFKHPKRKRPMRQKDA